MTNEVSATSGETRPLAVDLDGTLLRTDLLVEGLALLLRQNPFALVLLPWWFLRGRAYLKAQIARRVQPVLATLPYRRAVLEYLQAARTCGRRVVLATACDQRYAQAVAGELGLFDAVFASDGITNLAGEAKRRRLVAEFGEGGYDYLGDERRDLAVWRSAHAAVIVAPGALLRRQVARVNGRVAVLGDEGATTLDWLRALRVHHWLKNSLLFVPLLAAHRLDEPQLVWLTALAFVAFGLGASSAYLLNDLFDLEVDRHHPHKRDRPIPAGRISIKQVLVALTLLVTATVCLALQLPPAFGVALGVYYVANLAYSLRLKFVPILDVLLLAGFHVLRILAGTAADAIPTSPALLTFAMFLFLSLALSKRYAELVVMRRIDGAHARARGYQIDDAELLASLGCGAGYLAVLVLAFYIDTDTSRALYRHPLYLWALCPVLLFWVTHLWLVAHRRQMHDDPLVFALRDRTSLALLGVMAITVLVAL